MTFSNLQRRLEIVLAAVEQRLNSTQQRHKLILLHPETKQTVYETPDEELSALPPGEGRVVFILPQKRERRVSGEQH